MVDRVDFEFPCLIRYRRAGFRIRRMFVLRFRGFLVSKAKANKSMHVYVYITGLPDFRWTAQMTDYNELLRVWATGFYQVSP